MRSLRISLLCLLISYLCTVEQEGIAQQFVNDEGIAKHKDVLLATGFEDGIQAPLKIHRKGVSLASNPDLVFAGVQCLQITATKDVNQGGDVKYKWDKGVDVCYMRVYVRFDEDTVMPHHFIGLGGHTPTYKYRWGGSAGLRPPGDKDGKFSATLEPPKGEKGRWKFYTYWHEMRSWQTEHGETDGRPNAYYGNNFRADQALALPRDTWMCLEIMVKLNDVGKHNGEQAFWIDGKKIGHWKAGSPEGTWHRDNFHTYGQWNKDPQPFEGFNWRTDAALKLNSAYLQWYLSKNASWKKMTVDENKVYFDNLVIATSYIGPLRVE